MVPSLTFPENEIAKIVGNQFYEERMLFILLSLADPGTRIVYVTSVRVEEPIVDYYLRFVPDTRDAQERLYMISLWDARPKALTCPPPLTRERMRRKTRTSVVILTPPPVEVGAVPTNMSPVCNRSVGSRMEA